MIALLAVIASMHGCASVAVPSYPVPVTPGLARCDPGRLGWAADGSFWLTVQQPLKGENL
jgi:hypothetical protein